MAHGAVQSGQTPQVAADSHGSMVTSVRAISLSVVAIAATYIFNNFLTHWGGWPGALTFLGHAGLLASQDAVAGGQLGMAATQFALYFAVVAGIVYFVLRTPSRAMQTDADFLSAVVAYIVRAAFWAVLLIGIVDATISSLRVEGVLGNFFSAKLTADLGRSTFRGLYVHFPLILAGMTIAYFKRTLGFTWLALLIVVAELQIVVARFIFSYEQSFMADLVRFWYGALFLFASPYTLIHEGHVRVDILYAGFSDRAKAWANTFGSFFLGAPLCGVILTLGLWSKASVINGPVLTFETTQSGYGMYVKYLLAAYLLVFAFTMLVQFMSYVLSNMALLLHEPGAHLDYTEHAAI
ncbi:MAG: TRAP transporter small permease subunit [Proteobacteria bacterium]|nr:TRAP transporter small permease subunit [Pseudomonadota bacterium]